MLVEARSAGHCDYLALVSAAHHCKDQSCVNLFQSLKYDVQKYYVGVVMRFSVEDRTTYGTHVEVLSHFGYKSPVHFTAESKLQDGSERYVWFMGVGDWPMWNNQILDDGDVIREGARTQEACDSILNQIDNHKNSPGRKAIVFSRLPDGTNRGRFAYIGTFVVDLDDASKWHLSFRRLRVEEDTGFVS